MVIIGGRCTGTLQLITWTGDVSPGNLKLFSFETLILTPSTLRHDIPQNSIDHVGGARLSDKDHTDIYKLQSQVFK